MATGAEECRVTPQQIVESYLAQNFQILTWPQIGDLKGPNGLEAKSWPAKKYTLEDYREGCRVGLKLGAEVAPGRFLHDVDIDWQPGAVIALKLLPPTDFLYGRAGKKISHCFYLLPEALPIEQYRDIDNKITLLELRGTAKDGSIGLQTMAPPSIWSKDGKTEPLTFIRSGTPAFIDAELKERVTLAAIGMLLAKHLGVNGFGHATRLAWAGFLLRAGVPVDDLVAMGEAMSTVCNNLEVDDVRRSVESVSNQLKDPKAKVVGGPTLAKILGKTTGRAIISRINEWLGRDSDFIRDQNGMIVKDSQENIRRAFRQSEIELSYDEFSEKMLVADGPTAEPRAINDVFNNDIWLRIDHDYRFRPSKAFFDIVVENTAHQNPFHPVHDYLSTLTWDGVPRVNTWLQKYGRSTDSEYHQHVAAILLIAAVRRIRKSGCKYDEMVIFESEQGLNKSTALRTLCPKDEWFSDDLPLNVDAKEIIERTLGKWIIEASDMTGGRKADRDHLKSMLSRQVDGPARMAYGHFPVERARQFIIVGTTNGAEYLMDSTGARRFWPIRVRKFDIEGLARDRDQLWAEAAARETAGESIRLPESLWATAEEHQERRRTVDAWEEPITEGVEALMPSSSGRRQISTAHVWELIGIEMNRRDRAGSLRISEIMQKLGFQSNKIRLDGRLMVGYTSEIAAKKLDFTGED